MAGIGAGAIGIGSFAGPVIYDRLTAPAPTSTPAPATPLLFVPPPGTPGLPPGYAPLSPDAPPGYAPLPSPLVETPIPVAIPEPEVAVGIMLVGVTATLLARWRDRRRR